MLAQCWAINTKSQNNSQHTNAEVTKGQLQYIQAESVLERYSCKYLREQKNAKFGIFARKLHFLVDWFRLKFNLEAVSLVGSHGFPLLPTKYYLWSRPGLQSYHMFIHLLLLLCCMCLVYVPRRQQAGHGDKGNKEIIMCGLGCHLSPKWKSGFSQISYVHFFKWAFLCFFLTLQTLRATHLLFTLRYYCINNFLSLEG